jgi:hypothetical protein
MLYNSLLSSFRNLSSATRGRVLQDLTLEFNSLQYCTVLANGNNVSGLSEVSKNTPSETS